MRWIDTYEDFEQYLYQSRLTSFPVFSQKRGICMSDSISNIFWWCDRIRDVFWNAEVFSNPGLTYDTEVFQVSPAGGVQTFDPANITAFPVSRATAIRLWIKTSLYRLIQILQGQPIEFDTSGMLTRVPSGETLDPLKCNIPTGEQAAFHLYQYSMMNAEDVPKKTYTEGVPSYGIPPQIVPDALNMAFNLHGIGTDVQATSRDKPNPPGMFPVGLVILTGTVDALTGQPQNAHATVCVKIYGIWHYVDNEIGITIPIIHPDERPYTDDEINSPTTSFHYGSNFGPDKKIRSTRIVIVRTIAPGNHQVVWDFTTNPTYPISNAQLVHHESDATEFIGVPPGYTLDQLRRIIVYSSRPQPKIPAPVSSSSSSSSSTVSAPLVPEIVSGSITIGTQPPRRIVGSLGDEGLRLYTLQNEYIGYFKEGSGAAADPAPQATLKLDGMPPSNGRFYQMGGRRTRTSRRPLSGPRRRVRRSSSSSTKRYTRRRRALRS